MSAFENKLLALLLLTLLNIALSSPHTINKRSGPLLTDSRVEYALAEALESKNDIFEESEAETELLTEKKKNVIENTDALKKEVSGVETAGGPLPEILKSGLEPAKPDSIEKETDIKVTEVKKEIKDVPDPKYTIMPKPDGKDEKPFEGHYTPEEFGVVAAEEKEEDGKLEIGQIPILLPPFLPHAIHMLLRPRTFGGTPLVPLPPAVDISDRLPPVDADVVEESSETAVIEDVESGDKFVKGSSRVSGGHYDLPMSFGIPPLPMIPLQAILRDLSGESKLPGATKSEVLDVKGKKMLLQKKFLSFPSDDKSRFHLRIMSVQPLEHVDPMVLKEIGVEKGIKGDKGLEEKDIVKEDDIFKKSDEKEAGIGIKVIEKNVPSGDKIDIELHKEIEKREGEDSFKKETEIKETETEKDLSKEVKHTEERKLFPQSDILKTSETQVNEQVFVKAEEEVKKGEEKVESREVLEMGVKEAQNHLLFSKNMGKEEVLVKGKIDDSIKEEEIKGLKESRKIEGSEEKETYGVTEDKKVSKELKKDIIDEDMDLDMKKDMFFEEKEKITEEKEKKEILSKKGEKEKKKCKCEEKDSDSDSDEEDED